MILAGDIGGTHTRLALFEKGKKKTEQKFASRSYSGLEKIVKEFLASHNQKIAKACFGIAGPVREGKVSTTNLPWKIDAKELSVSLKIEKIALLNDLEANAYGIKRLARGDFLTLQEGNPHQTGNQALISAGTGLGEAGLYWDGREHQPFACEGGHSDFAPQNEKEFELFLYLQKKYGHVSYERVVSGPGLYDIYRFLVDIKKKPPSSQVEAEIEQKDPSTIVSKWGKEKKDPVCQEALSWFLSFYGGESGNLALKFLALGGVFIGGGIAPHLKEELKTKVFLSPFSNKGRFKELLLTIPIKVILNDSAALLGASYFAEEIL